jgi:hypothetical protein
MQVVLFAIMILSLLSISKQGQGLYDRLNVKIIRSN